MLRQSRHKANACVTSTSDVSQQRAWFSSEWNEQKVYGMKRGAGVWYLRHWYEYVCAYRWQAQSRDLFHRRTSSPRTALSLSTRTENHILIFIWSQDTSVHLCSECETRLNHQPQWPLARRSHFAASSSARFHGEFTRQQRCGVLLTRRFSLFFCVLLSNNPIHNIPSHEWLQLRKFSLNHNTAGWFVVKSIWTSLKHVCVTSGKCQAGLVMGLISFRRCTVSVPESWCMRWCNTATNWVHPLLAQIHPVTQTCPCRVVLGDSVLRTRVVPRNPHSPTVKKGITPGFWQIFDQVLNLLLLLYPYYYSDRVLGPLPEVSCGQNCEAHWREFCTTRTKRSWLQSAHTSGQNVHVGTPKLLEMPGWPDSLWKNLTQIKPTSSSEKSLLLSLVWFVDPHSLAVEKDQFPVRWQFTGLSRSYFCTLSHCFLTGGFTGLSMLWDSRSANGLRCNRTELGWMDRVCHRGVFKGSCNPWCHVFQNCLNLHLVTVNVVTAKSKEFHVRWLSRFFLRTDRKNPHNSVRKTLHTRTQSSKCATQLLWKRFWDIVVPRIAVVVLQHSVRQLSSTYLVHNPERALNTFRKRRRKWKAYQGNIKAESETWRAQSSRSIELASPRHLERSCSERLQESTEEPPNWDHFKNSLLSVWMSRVGRGCHCNFIHSRCFLQHFSHRQMVSAFLHKGVALKPSSPCLWASSSVSGLLFGEEGVWLSQWAVDCFISPGCGPERWMVMDGDMIVRFYSDPRPPNVITPAWKYGASTTIGDKLHNYRLQAGTQVVALGFEFWMSGCLSAHENPYILDQKWFFLCFPFKGVAELVRWGLLTTGVSASHWASTFVLEFCGSSPPPLSLSLSLSLCNCWNTGTICLFQAEKCQKDSDRANQNQNNPLLSQFQRVIAIKGRTVSPNLWGMLSNFSTQAYWDRRWSCTLSQIGRTCLLAVSIIFLNILPMISGILSHFANR